MKIMLIKNLFVVITENPTDILTNDWQRKDIKTRALINLRIKDNQIIHIKHLNTA